MANYESVTRSNYFHVKDEDAFSKFMDTVSGDDMHCWSDKDRGWKYVTCLWMRWKYLWSSERS